MRLFPHRRLTVCAEPRLSGLLVVDQRPLAAPWRGRTCSYPTLERQVGEPGLFVVLDEDGRPVTNDGRLLQLSVERSVTRLATRAWRRSIARSLRSGNLDVTSRIREARPGLMLHVLLLATMILGIGGAALFVARWPVWPTNSGALVLMCTFLLPITIPLVLTDLRAAVRIIRTRPATRIRCTASGIEIERDGRATNEIGWSHVRRVRRSIVGLHLHTIEKQSVDIPYSPRNHLIAALATAGVRRGRQRTLTRHEKLLLVGLYLFLIAAPFIGMVIHVPPAAWRVSMLLSTALQSLLVAAVISLACVAISHLDRIVRRHDAKKRRKRRSHSHAQRALS